ncbi:unnamed protein product [Ascophyllum nodosum]
MSDSRKRRGSAALHFDRTLTKFWVNGEMGYSCHMVIANFGLLSEDYHDKTTELRNRYYPMEVDPDLPHEEKLEAMKQWVLEAHEAMVETGMTKSTIVEAVSKANLELRPGHDKLFRLLETEKVPFLVFSAGLADVLEEIFRQRAEAPVPSTCHVISNRMEFDDEGKMIGFKGKTYHVFNKLASPEEPYFRTEEMKGRTNVLLLGDSLGDLKMSKGIETKEVLTIGFLNDNVDEMLEEYMDAYDAVIVGDGGLDLALEILGEVTAKAD